MLPKDTMDVKEAARYLAMDEKTVAAMAAERRIPALAARGEVALLEEVDRQVARRSDARAAAQRRALDVAATGYARNLGECGGHFEAPA